MAGSPASAAFYLLFVRKLSIAEVRSGDEDAAARLVIWCALGMRSRQRNKAIDIDNASNSGYVYTRR